MTHAIIISEKGYSKETLGQLTETSDICPHETTLIVAAHDRYQRSVSRVYYADGTIVDTLQSTNRLMEQLENATGYQRRDQVEAYYCLLPTELRGQMRSWVMQNHAFVPVTSYKSSPTTWINARHIVDVQTRGMRTSVLLRDGSVVQIAKHKDKFIKQLVATKVVSLWMTQYTFGHGDRFDKMLLSCVSWPKQVPQHVDRLRLIEWIVILKLESLLRCSLDAITKKMIRGVITYLMKRIEENK